MAAIRPFSAAYGAGIMLCLAFQFAGCSQQDPASPEQQIRAMLDRAETAIEARDLAGIGELISSRYTDETGRDPRELRRLLAGYFFRHQSVHLLKQLEQLSLQSEDEARVVVFAGVAGARAAAVDSLSQWRGDLVRLEADLVREEDHHWRLLRASWRRASRGDLLH